MLPTDRMLIQVTTHARRGLLRVGRQSAAVRLVSLQPPSRLQLHRTLSAAAETGEANKDTPDGDGAEVANDFLSPSTANTFKNYVRQRAAGLAAKAEAHAAAGTREWRDSPQLRSLKQAAAGGVIRHTRAQIKEGRLDDFLAWAEQHLHKAYAHEGFRSAQITVDRDAHIVENHTTWTSDLAIAQNSNLAVYRNTMRELSEFCVGAPEVTTKQVVLAITGPSSAGGVGDSTAAPSQMAAGLHAAGDKSKDAPASSTVAREDASGIDYSY